MFRHFLVGKDIGFIFHGLQMRLSKYGNLVEMQFYFPKKSSVQRRVSRLCHAHKTIKSINVKIELV